MGTSLMNVQQLFSQGSFANSTQATDMAISGGGFFMVNGNVSGVAGNFYTRAGQFQFDNGGYLTNQQGLRVQGYPVGDTDQAGNIAGALGDIQITDTQIQPNATSAMSINANLDSDAPILTAPWDATNFTTAAETSNFHTTVTVYDSLGTPHDTTIYFRKTINGVAPAGNTWEYRALVDGGETGGVAGTPVEITPTPPTPTVEFSNNGRLAALTPAVPTMGPVTFTGAAPQTINLNIGTVGSTDPNPSGLTQFDAGGTGSDQGNGSAVLFTDQDGYSTGNLRFINVTEDGLITGAYSNGETLNLGKVALANFQANSGLKKLGGNIWAETRDSGQPLIGEANTGNRGTVKGNSLEQSTVDLAQEFVDMIVTQRAFQANSKSITTTDTMLGEVMNLKR